MAKTTDSNRGESGAASRKHHKSSKRSVFTLRSGAFEDGHTIPTQFTCDGENVSPSLSWQHAPRDTKSFALIVSDPDAPRGQWFHWVVYNIPADVSSLPANAALGPPSLIGQSSWPLRRYYSGPCPPVTARAHRYLFKLYALNDTLRLPDLDAHGLLAAMADSYLSSSVLMGVYVRRSSNAIDPPPPPPGEENEVNSGDDSNAVLGVAANEQAIRRPGGAANLGKLRVFKASLDSSSREFCSSDDAVPQIDGISRVRVIVTGSVQNVYYGQYAVMTAVDVGVTGWVKNLPDGTVEVVAEGSYSQLCQVIRWCHTGSPRSAVSNVEVEWQTPERGLSAFHRYDK